MSSIDISVEQLSVNTIRTLAIDAVQKANSGHPGLPMGAAPMAYVLWQNICATIPVILTGRTVTALCCRQVMAACFFTVCFIYTATT